MKDWLTEVNDLHRLLSGLSVRDSNGMEIDCDTAFKQLKNYSLMALERKKTVYLIGNGASASISNQVAADLARNTGLRTETFFNLSLITAIASDMNYDQVFTVPLIRKMEPGDILVAVTDSGEAQNTINAVKEAKRIGGSVFTFSAINPDNILRSLGLINFYVPADSHEKANICNTALLHYWTEQMTSAVTWQEDNIKTFSRHNRVAVV
jgi:D-sedoheptulose 7-phosphate isomerase